MPSEKELEKRVGEFSKELSALLGKYKLALIGVPYLVQNKTGGFEIFSKPQVLDASAMVEADQELSES